MHTPNTRAVHAQRHGFVFMYTQTLKTYACAPADDSAAHTLAGRVVVDKELITGLPDGKEANCMAVYQVNDQGLICRVQSLESSRN